MFTDIDPARVAAARALATALRRATPQSSRPQLSSKENDNFVEDFMGASRLHFIGSWKARFSELLDAQPPAPPLPTTDRLTERVIMHIDLDCFFASVASLHRPELSGLPVAVSWSGSTKGSAEIASANYRARRDGVKNGMWVPRATELCPHLVIMPYEFDRYEVVAEAMYKAVFDVTPHVMGISCDECFADVTGLPVDAERLGEALRASILRETGGCTASVGIGPNRLLARLATARAKPDGLLRLRAADAAELLRDEPVRTLPDCGHDREEKLGAIGIATCGDLVAADASRLRKAVGPKVAEKLLAYARGGDPRPWEPRPERKSVGAQASWGVRFESDEGAEKFCRDLARQVAERMRQGAAVKGRSLTLKLWRAMRDAPAGMSKGHLGHGLCDILNRSVALPGAPTDDADVLQREAVAVLRALAVPPAEVRGMGIQVTKLEGAGGGGGGASHHDQNQPTLGFAPLRDKGDDGGGDGGGERPAAALVARAKPATTYDPARAPRWYGGGGKKRESDAMEPRSPFERAATRPRSSEASPAAAAEAPEEEAASAAATRAMVIEGVRARLVAGVLDGPDPVDGGAVADGLVDVLVGAAAELGRAAAAEVVGEAREMALALVGAEGCRGDVLPRWLEACDVAERRLVS